MVSKPRDAPDLSFTMVPPPPVVAIPRPDIDDVVPRAAVWDSPEAETQPCVCAAGSILRSATGGGSGGFKTPPE